MKFLIIFIFLSYYLGSVSVAQNDETQTINVPLTNPNEVGSLKLHQVSGSISVTGYNGNSVVVKASAGSQNRHKDREKGQEKNGMFRIPNNAYNISVIEKENEVNISNHSPNQVINFDIMVPQNFSLNLHTVNNGHISIENIEGDIETNNVNGSIKINQIAGSVIASTINGKVEVKFTEVTPDVPMAFSSLNGKIDVTFPENIKATAKIRNERGEIYSDFEMSVRKSSPVVEKNEGKDYKKYVIDKWVYGDINGGGPEFLFKNMNGNIYIRKL